jgi:calcineurin-like phosphoesterase family protein
MIEGLYKCFDHWHKQGTVWLYSDTHFNEDEDLHVPFPNRPSAEEQIRLINSKVGRKDTLILLGDVGDIECARKLRGYKILIKGNHDLGLSNYEDVFDEVYGGPLMIGEKIILSHEPLDISWAFNIHGHTHCVEFNRKGHLCVCSDFINYTPVNFNQFVKSGRLREVTPMHRATIDKATERKRRK